ncbi:FAD-dependent monooxygenase [Hoyosella subflava]|uniref:Putative monooxygenase n=1 Tax=Hoyosella subflava (strain DSM 45089 / JCM 17490 / NBRC 109087 / DQS3-9A1) TaxID=443218 RepID=F6EIB5_HOYSD|nr:FAD-dependent monooxygenase [Hoyosella subflava]AEF41222.1 Putative monooxygenase [Hoyosella subflava DQS3-9A1]
MSTYYQPRKYPPSNFSSMPVTGQPIPVLVVGAGPVGMAAALGLAQRGIPVTLIEAADQVSFGSRAICVSRHSLEVAERLGFGDALERIVLPWVGGRSFYRDREVLRFQMPHRDHDVRPPMVNVSQSEFEQLMVDAIEQNPLITLHWQTSIAGFNQDSDAVTVHLDTAFGPRGLRAQWVIAADGGRSKTRELADLKLQGTSYTGRYVIADIHWKSGLPAERMVWFDAPSNPGSTIIMHQQPNDIWRIDYQLDPSEDVDTETQEERIRERIARHLAWLGNDSPWTLEWHGFYGARALALDSFVHGRVIFAGDAAHLVPIFGVRGLNSGMEDAETLSWQLAAVVNGTAEPSLLAAYSAERRAAWEQNIDNAGKSTLIMSPGSPGYRATRDAVLELATARPEFAHLINPRQSSATHARLSPLTWPVQAGTVGVLPGDPLEDRKIGRTSLNELRGNGFTLLGIGIDDVAAASLASFATVLAQQLKPEPVTAVAVGTEDQGLSEALGARPGEVFVIRPDGLVLARVSSMVQLSRIAEHLRVGTAPIGGQVLVHMSSVLAPEERLRENVWAGLSDALDQVDDREGFLTRLAMLLGSQTGQREFQEALAIAAEPNPVGVDADELVGAEREVGLEA